MCSAGAGASGINGINGAASIGRTSWASAPALFAALTGSAPKARKERRMLAVTLPAEVHGGFTFLRLENMLILFPKS